MKVAFVVVFALLASRASGNEVKLPIPETGIREIDEGLRIAIVVVGTVSRLWEMIGGENSTEELSEMGMDRRVMDGISWISQGIEAFEERSEQRSNAALAMILKQLPERYRLEQRMDELKDCLRKVEDFYKLFQAYSDSKYRFERHTLEDFATRCVSHDQDSVQTLLDKIHRFIVPRGSFSDRTVLNLLVNSFKETPTEICNASQSPQQLLYSLYKALAVIELKGYAIMQFSWILLRVYNKGNFTDEAQFMKQRYQSRTTESLETVRSAMKDASRDFWRCDPPSHRRDTTYTELTRLLQSYIINEVDLNVKNTCWKNCGYYDHTVEHGCEFSTEYCSKQRRCEGMLHNCRYVGSDMRICPAERGGSRRYEYIEYENGVTYGRKDTCTRFTTTVESWRRWLFWQCSYCMCFCDDDRDSDRYFNIRNVMADIQDDKVITGMRFVKAKQVIHLQIQQGKLLPRGGINKTTIRWKPIDDYRIFDYNVDEGQDYLRLSWEQRVIDLDDLTAPKGHLLTGVRFRKLGTHLNFEIMSTPFNFTSGVLLKAYERSEWRGNDNTDISWLAPRTELDIKNPDLPTRSIAESIPDSKTDQYLWFVASDLAKDAGQSTVPFIDIQPVVPNPPIPLSGAGIFHKGRKGYGGYIAPKLITYDFEPHLHEGPPPPAIERKQ